MSVILKTRNVSMFPCLGWKHGNIWGEGTRAHEVARSDAADGRRRKAAGRILRGGVATLERGKVAVFFCGLWGRGRSGGVAQVVGWVWRQPARPSAYGCCCGVRASSGSGGLAAGALGGGGREGAPNTPQPTVQSAAARWVWRSAAGSEARAPAAACCGGSGKPRQTIAKKGSPALQLRRNWATFPMPFLAWPGCASAAGG